MSEKRVLGGRFEMGDVLGQGGMGAVYHGIDLQTGEHVAIKSLKSEIVALDPGMVDRFAREGEALRKLNHPNIVKMLGAVTEGNEHFLVMEYVGGGSLRELLDEQSKLPIDRVTDIALDLSDALTRAHRLKIIHRDIKPANVLLAEDGTPRLTDFGVARTDDSTMTQTGSMLGTPAYLSPEAASGEAANSRTDIWAFGVMLYEMLAGRRPFDETNTMALLTAIMSKPVPSLLQFRPDTPPRLAALIHQMLEKDETKRISSVRQIGVQLEAIIGGVETPPPATPEEITADWQTDDTPTQTDPHPVTPSRVTPSGTRTTPASRPAGTTPTPQITRADWSSTGVRQIARPVRIFISYRRADSLAVVGRIYDRLVAAFGTSNVFKDMDKIPPGANFKEVIDNAVGDCDVLLVIIGPGWANASDERSNRRLDDPNDFVRIEVEAGLRRDEVLVIPVLVNDADMIAPDELPGDLNELAYRNAAVVRNDPDFNRDIVWLTNQIKNSFQFAPPKPRNRLLIGGALVVLVAVLIAAFLLITNGAKPSEPTASAQTSAIQPVNPGEYMVLVAQIENVGGTQRDVQRFIVENLQNIYEHDIPLSNLRIRAYPNVIKSDDEARLAADSVGAAVIVWGNYNADRVELNLQFGSNKAFPMMEMSRSLVEQVVNLRVDLKDELKQSIATEVLYVMALGQLAEGDTYPLYRSLTILPQLQVEHGELVGNNAPNYFYRASTTLSDFQAAIDQINQALPLFPKNPLLYASRAAFYYRLGNFDSANQDIETAAQYAPATWLYPDTLRGAVAAAQDNLPGAIDAYTHMVKARPNDWYPYYFRGIFYYAAGNYALARADLQQSIDLGPDVNFPYAFAASIALRDGRFADVQALYQTVLKKFPDPTFGNEIIRAVVGDQVTQPFPVDVGSIISAFGNLTLKQYPAVVKDMEQALSGKKQYADMYLVLGFAECNLRDYTKAEDAYTKGIALDPKLYLLYALRAEARLKKSPPDLFGATADVAALTQSPQADIYRPFIAASQTGKFNCENFFDADFTTILASVPETTAVPTTVAVAPSATPPAIAPVQSNQYMVLVAQIEQVGGTTRDVQRFIVEDLTHHFQDEVPFSVIRVRSYPGTIKSDADAQALAESVGADVVIWGTYDDKGVQVEVELGSLKRYSNLLFSRADMEKIVNVQAQMTDERRQSLAPQVVAVINGVYSFTGNIYELARNVALLEVIDVTSADIPGNGISAHYHRYIISFVKDPATSVKEMDAAIALEANNPFLYAARGLARQRLGQLDTAREDILTAQQLGPKNWLSPVWELALDAFYLRQDYDSALTYFNQAVALHPDDWFMLIGRGAVYYLKGQYDLAQADIDASIKLGPDTNFPYFFAIGLALRQGRFVDAQVLYKTILTKFPDPTYAQRLLKATLGTAAPDNPTVLLASAFGNLILGQWSSVVQDVNTAVTNGQELPELYFMQGFAYCNLKDYPNAETAYTSGIAKDSQFWLLYALRAEVRLKQNNLLGAAADVATVTQSPQGDLYRPLIAAVQSGKLSCENLFDADLQTLLSATAVPTAAPTTTPIAIEPVQPGQYRVLVAQFEPVNTPPRDVNRFIVDDLTRSLQDDVPFSRIQLRQYPQVIQSDDDARQVAAATGAAVIVWGNYDSSSIQIDVQVGVTSAFKYLQFDRATLEKTANVRVRLTSEVNQTVAPQVLGVLTVLQNADGNLYEIARNLAIYATIDTTGGEMVGNSVAARYHRFFATYQSDTAAAISQMDEAIKLDARNPLLYSSRALARQRLGQLDSARQDIQTAQAFGPQNWTMPLYLLAFDGLFLQQSNKSSGLTYFSQIVTLHPDEWFPLTIRGAIYFMQRDYDHAETDLEAAIALNPDANMPYGFAAIIAERKGHIHRALELYYIVQTRFPDPDFQNRLISATWGDFGMSKNLFGALSSALGNGLLGQWDTVLSEIDTVLSINDQLPEAYSVQGLAYCAQGQYAKAETALNRAIELDPTMPMNYVLRAMTRLKTGNAGGALVDGHTAVQMFQQIGGDDIGILVQAGQFSCDSFSNPTLIAQVLKQMDAALTATPTAEVTVTVQPPTLPTPTPGA